MFFFFLEIASRGVTETYCGTDFNSGYGCSYQMGDTVTLDVKTDSLKASIWRSEIIAIHIENRFEGLDADVTY